MNSDDLQKLLGGRPDCKPVRTVSNSSASSSACGGDTIPATQDLSGGDTIPATQDGDGVFSADEEDGSDVSVRETSPSDEEMQ